MSAPAQANRPAATLERTRRLEAVLFDRAVLVDPYGVAYADVEPSLLAAQEAGLRLMVASARDREGAREVMPDLAFPLDEIATATGDEGLPETLSRARLRPETTLHVAADPRRLRHAAAGGARTAWVNRCGLTAQAAPDHEWRDLLGLVALCRTTPSLVRSDPRC
jgi:hypothetical protein